VEHLLYGRLLALPANIGINTSAYCRLHNSDRFFSNF
jgi:hypothetical protein